FHAELAGPGVGVTNDEGFWKGGPGNLTLVAREGSAPPSLPGLSFTNLDGVADAAGHVLLRSTLTGAGANDANRDALFTDRSGQLALLLRKGDAAPSTEPGTVFGGNSPFPAFAFNDDSKLALKARLVGPAITGVNDEVVYVERGGLLQRILRKGDPAPGAGPGVTFGGSLTDLGTNSIEFNSNGRLA